MYKTKMTSKGQFTLPKKLRHKLELEPEDYLLCEQLNENRFKKFVGILKSRTESDKVIKELRDGLTSPD